MTGNTWFHSSALRWLCASLLLGQSIGASASSNMLENTAAEKPTVSVFSQFAAPSCVFSGVFSQRKNIVGLSEPLLSEGVFLSHCEKGIVWKTITPIEESLVFTRAGRRVRVEDGKSSILKTPQSRILGELMNGLVAWQPDYINDNFDWHLNDAQAESIQLAPKKPSLRRALEWVNLWRTKSASNLETGSETHALAADILNIEMLDTRQQKTYISAEITKQYPEDAEPSAYCENDPALFSLTECAALQNRDAGKPK